MKKGEEVKVSIVKCLVFKIFLHSFILMPKEQHVLHTNAEKQLSHTATDV
jgi:hypothetical protein